jgi:signal recognition particle subunit SRP54
VILDTSGRLHIDEPLMQELTAIAGATAPTERLMVADAMTGQDAVNSALRFNADLDLTGFILTKLDGDSRGGAALSIRSVTGKPIKFIVRSRTPSNRSTLNDWLLESSGWAIS